MRAKGVGVRVHLSNCDCALAAACDDILSATRYEKVLNALAYVERTKELAIDVKEMQESIRLRVKDNVT